MNDAVKELYLAHHGIKGQKWGVRNYQNEDGSLTEAGKTRYARGKQYRKERVTEYTKEYNKLIKSKEYTNKANEAKRLAEKYDLDMDDGGGGNNKDYSKEELRRAGDRYFNIISDMDELSERYNAKASEHANKYIEQKYGKTALSDIKHYDNVNTLAFIGGLSALIIAGKVTSSMKKQKSLFRNKGAW